MTTPGYRLSAIAGSVLAAALLGACSGDDRAGAAGTPAVGAESGVAPAGPQEPCPLTVDEVGAVVGVSVRKDATTCMFEPEPGEEPRVLYVRQVSFACSDDVVNDVSVSFEPYDGLGIEAYTSAAGDLLVCTNPPFEITVEITPDLDDTVADPAAASAAARASERAAAEQLALLILER